MISKHCLSSVIPIIHDLSQVRLRSLASSVEKDLTRPPQVISTPLWCPLPGVRIWGLGRVLCVTEQHRGLQEVRVDAQTPLATISEFGSTDRLYRRRATVEALPDDVLLEIFIFYLDDTHREDFDAWHPLVHVCNRWRHVVFASPRRLNLRLSCTERRPVRKMLGIWPALPVVIWNTVTLDSTLLVEGAKNIIAALEHNDRVCEIFLEGSPNWIFERLAAEMEGPFPSLTSLALLSRDEPAPVLPESFLGKSAPRLRSLRLNNMPTPLLRKLPLIASDLVELSLWHIPDSVYVSPKAMATCLARLTALRLVSLRFHSPQSRPKSTSRRRPPLTRVVLPSLVSCRFHGVGEYLEDFVAQIDVPLLDRFEIIFFNQLLFHTPQILQFLSRAETLNTINQATVVFLNDMVAIILSQKTETVNHTGLSVAISCTQSDWQLSSLAQICVSSLPHLSTLERLVIHEGRRRPPAWQDDMENRQWLELLQPFAAVKDLYLSKQVALRVAPILQGISTETTPEVLPALQTFFLEESQAPEPIQEGIGHFVAVRQLSGHPVAIHDWERGKEPDYL